MLPQSLARPEKWWRKARCAPKAQAPRAGRPAGPEVGGAREQGIERRQRPVQGGARVRQLPGEPGALRGCGLRVVGGHR